MNEEKFWQLIESIHNNGLARMNDKCDFLTQQLANLSSEDALAFQNLFDQQMDTAYSWKLWGAAYVIGGGCSDDAFTDFRSALISRGEAPYKAALANPDSLAEQVLDEELVFYEGYQYAVSEGVEKAIGTRPERYKPHPSEPSGEEWSEDGESLQKLFPTLWAKVEGQYVAEVVADNSDEKLPLRENPGFRFLMKLQVFGVCAILILYVVNKYFLS